MTEELIKFPLKSGDHVYLDVLEDGCIEVTASDTQLTEEIVAEIKDTIESAITQAVYPQFKDLPEEEQLRLEHYAEAHSLICRTEYQYPEYQDYQYPEYQDYQYPEYQSPLSPVERYIPDLNKWFPIPTYLEGTNTFLNEGIYRIKE